MVLLTTSHVGQSRVGYVSKSLFPKISGINSAGIVVGIVRFQHARNGLLLMGIVPRISGILNAMAILALPQASINVRREEFVVSFRARILLRAKFIARRIMLVLKHMESQDQRLLCGESQGRFPVKLLAVHG